MGEAVGLPGDRPDDADGVAVAPHPLSFDTERNAESQHEPAARARRGAARPGRCSR